MNDRSAKFFKHYKNKNKKIGELVSESCDGRCGEVIEEVGLIRVYYMHIWKHYNEIPLYNNYM
jgi:hypothetical protein